MNLYLAELLNSIPPEFSVKNQSKSSIRFHYKNKEIHVEWFDDGPPCTADYYENGRQHRPISEGPAHQSWHDNGQPSIISYWENGSRHRPISEGPARQVWKEDGSLGSEEYWENGKQIRSRGPTK